MLSLEGSPTDVAVVAGEVVFTPRIMAREGVLGMVIGMIGGAVGVALGVLRLPALIQVLKMQPGMAAGSNLMITILVSLRWV